jgi:hypothetical protein
LLTLNWDLEGQQINIGKGNSTRNDRFLVPDYYRIWMRWNNFSYQDTSESQTYSRNIQLSGNYEFYVRAVFLLGGIEEIYSAPSDTISFTLTAGEDETDSPVVFALQQNYPNPFNPTTSIAFSLPERERVTLGIYNIKGQLVKELVSETREKGKQTVIWNGNDTSGKQSASGIYWYKLSWQGKEITRKMVLLK